MKAGWKAIRDRLGPVGLSLAAAAITAAGFAAISVAQDDGDGGEDGRRGDRMAIPAPPPPGAPMFRERLSDEDRQKLDEFRRCMEEHGAPAPPRPDRGEGPPEPPSDQERGQIEDAFDACGDQLPEGVRHAGPPPFGCPPPALRDDEDGERGDDSGENEQQGHEIPAPAPAPGGRS